MNTIFNLDAANLFIGDEDPNDSQFLTLKDVTLPSLNESTRSHMPAGGAMAIEIGNRQIDAFQMSFNLDGFNPDVITRFMPTAPNRIKYTIRGNMRDLRAGTDIECRAVVEGRMTQASMGAFSKDGGVQSEYQISEIVMYELYFDGNEKFYFDVFAGLAGCRRDGAPMFDQAAANIGLV